MALATTNYGNVWFLSAQLSLLAFLKYSVRSFFYQQVSQLVNQFNIAQIRTRHDINILKVIERRPKIKGSAGA